MNLSDDNINRIAVSREQDGNPNYGKICKCFRMAGKMCHALMAFHRILF